MLQGPTSCQLCGLVDGQAGWWWRWCTLLASRPCLLPAVWPGRRPGWMVVAVVHPACFKALPPASCVAWETARLDGGGGGAPCLLQGPASCQLCGLVDGQAGWWWRWCTLLASRPCLLPAVWPGRRPGWMVVAVVFPACFKALPPASCVAWETARLDGGGGGAPCLLQGPASCQLCGLGDGQAGWWWRWCSLLASRPCLLPAVWPGRRPGWTVVAVVFPACFKALPPASALQAPLFVGGLLA